uniref:SKI-interacting protein SKIP SNW domain-containing protein n=1 Tax=Leersia perrieri TaxID=77586 RepID=A0A0D9WNA9_9ORYZ
MALLVPPPYGRRSALAPRRKEDFGDGGAFPEIHLAQYPLDMGRRGDGTSSNNGVLSLTVVGNGRVAFDAVVRQGEKTVYSSPDDVLPKINAADDDEDEEDVEATTARTSAALRAIVEKRLSAAQPSSTNTAKFVKYTPARQSSSSAFNSGSAERIIMMAETATDPLEPPKFKHKRVPRPAGSPPVPVLRSPPRPLSQKDQGDWKIVPSVSNWKNNHGYTIPLDKREAASAAGLSSQEVQISDGFAGLAESLYVAERKASEAIETRNKVHREMEMRKKAETEQKLVQMAKKALEEKVGAPAAAGEVAERDPIREARRRERRMEKTASKKGNGDEHRNVSERIALGMASTTGGAVAGGEVGYDQRLFNQEKGMDSGFAAADQYNVYSGRLFAAQAPAMSMLYRPSKHGDGDIYGDDADGCLEKIAKTRRFVPDKAFSGAPASVAGKRERPVEFDEPGQEEEKDPFHLDQFLAQIKKGKQH